MRNIEIKAKLRSVNEIYTIVQNPRIQFIESFWQRDLYFKTEANGRLKIRTIIKDGEKQPVYELIYYERSDSSEPKLSTYVKTQLTAHVVECIQSILLKILQKDQMVEKLRSLYLFGQSRIHIDHVENLGEFLEIEVVLNDNQSESEGKNILNNLMTLLKIKQSDLLEGSYNDLLKQKEQQHVSTVTTNPQISKTATNLQ